MKEITLPFCVIFFYLLVIIITSYTVGYYRGHEAMFNYCSNSLDRIEAALK
jgi:O-antigen/teichoic acid export membrane protein